MVKQATSAINAEKTELMAIYRKDELESKNQELKIEDFASEEEYRKALMVQYEQLRKEEYRYTVQNETLKTYNLTCDGRNSGVNENKSWDAYNSHPNIVKNHEEHADSAQVQQFPKICKGMGISAKGMNSHKNIDSKTGKVKSEGAYSCAITASALQMQISDKMGYTGQDNIIQPSKGTKLTSAADAATCVDKQYQLKGNGKMTLNQMIMQGKINVGDEVAIVTKNNAAVKTASGKHSLTIAAINRDETGKITSYIVQANNVCRYMSVDPNYDGSLSIGNRVVHNAVKTHEWINDKIATEVKNMENLSTEELAKKVNEQRMTTEKVIDKLAINEEYAATHRKNNGRGVTYIDSANVAYNEEYRYLRGKYEARKQKTLETDVKEEQVDSTKKNEQKKDFKDDYFISHADERKEEEKIRKENEKNAQKDNNKDIKENKNEKIPQPEKTTDNNTLDSGKNTKNHQTRKKNWTVGEVIEILRTRSK